MDRYLEGGWNLLLKPLQDRARQAREGRFAHYTSATVATQILDNQEVWLRKIEHMSDDTELMIGAAVWQFTFGSSPIGRELRSRFLTVGVDPLWPGYLREAQGKLSADTYLTCFTEHPKREHESYSARHGRHDMHKNYGGWDGVALVFTPGALLLNADSPDEAPLTPLIVNPMRYLSPEHPLPEAKRMLQKWDTLAPLGHLPASEDLAEFVRYWAMFTLMTVKHPTYEHEHEWRVIYSPSLIREWGLPDTSGIEIADREIRGRSESVCIVHLDQLSAAGFPGLGRTEFLDQVIVGRCRLPEYVHSVMFAAVTRLGFQDAAARVLQAAHRWHGWG